MRQLAVPVKLQPSEDALLPLARGGDGDALSELMRRYEPFIAASARMGKAPGLDADDLMQEGRLGLVLAVRGYASGRGASFRTYARLCIKRRMISAVRRARGGKNVPLSNYVPLDDEDGPQNCVSSENPEDIVISMECMKALQGIVAGSFTSFERRLFPLYLAGLSYEEMAKRLRVPKKQVDNSLQRIKRKLGVCAG